MRIIVSGGLGYVGGRLSKYLAEKGNEVMVLSRQVNALSHMKWPRKITVEHPNALFKYPERMAGADVFIHLAAMNEIDCLKFPEQALKTNTLQTYQWLDRVYQAGVKRFVYFSTAHVYGKPLQGDYTETSLTAPVHPYSITHRAAEDYVLSYVSEKSMNNVVIRLTNSFGPPAFPTADRWTLLVNDLCRMAVMNATMVLYSDGQYRDFVCLEDVCSGLSLLLQQPDENAGIYNLATGASMTVWDMATQIQVVAEKLLKKKISLKLPNVGSKPISPLHISSDKLQALGWQPANDIIRELEGTLRYFQAYPV